jgi:4-hydroxy-2-oxoheptanedioate aldolase
MKSPTPNQFKQTLAAGGKQVGLWLTLESPIATEIAAGSGYDWMLLDMEHTGNDIGGIAAHINAAKGGTAELVVRIPSIDPVLVKRLLDIGVRSLMFPFVQTEEEALLAVASTRYPPHGIRGMGGNSRANNFTRIKDYLSTYQAEVCIVIQVETPQAVASIGKFGAIEGIDAIFVGPNDLAANMGHLGQPGAPEVLDAIAGALKDIKATGKAAGLLNFAVDQAKAQFDAGFDFIAVGSDTGLLMRNADALRGQFSS